MHSKLTTLEAAIAADDALAVQDAIFELGSGTAHGHIEDEIALSILEILRRPEMWNSSVAGHVMNFFEFEATRLSKNAKAQCATFLRECGNQFTDVHSVQVVGELLYGHYLQATPPKPPRKKPRHEND